MRHFLNYLRRSGLLGAAIIAVAVFLGAAGVSNLRHSQPIAVQTDQSTYGGGSYNDATYSVGSPTSTTTTAPSTTTTTTSTPTQATVQTTTTLVGTRSGTTEELVTTTSSTTIESSTSVDTPTLQSTNPVTKPITPVKTSHHAAVIIVASVVFIFLVLTAMFIWQRKTHRDEH